MQSSGEVRIASNEFEARDARIEQEIRRLQLSGEWNAHIGQTALFDATGDFVEFVDSRSEGATSSRSGGVDDDDASPGDLYLLSHRGAVQKRVI